MSGAGYFDIPFTEDAELAWNGSHQFIRRETKGIRGRADRPMGGRVIIVEDPIVIAPIVIALLMEVIGNQEKEMKD